MDIPPICISDEIVPICINNYLIPVDANDHPCWLAMPGTDDVFLPVFSSVEKLDAIWTDCSLIPYRKIKQITDQRDFLDSLGDQVIDHTKTCEQVRIRVAVDPYRHINGKVRFQEIILPQPMPD